MSPLLKRFGSDMITLSDSSAVEWRNFTLALTAIEPRHYHYHMQIHLNVNPQLLFSISQVHAQFGVINGQTEYIIIFR